MKKVFVSYMKLMRVKHWVKNFLVFLPLIFSGELFSSKNTHIVVVGFFVFSFLASSIYILNDIKDVKKDRLHQKKKYRPIASGAISVKAGITLLCTCFFISIILNLLFIKSYMSCAYICVYFVINILYSNGLKNIPILDIVILASGFLLRLSYGGVVANIEISEWLYLTVIMASFYMGLGKRRNELGKDNQEIATRGVLKFYDYNFLDKNMYMCLGLAQTFYALWAAGTGNKIMLWTVPVVVTIGMKYSLNIEKESDGDPVEVLAHDKLLWVMTSIYMALVICALYVY